MPEPDFEKRGGLVPAIAQDAASGEILMVAYMNREAWQRTLATPKCSLEAATIELFRRSGWKINADARSYFPTVDDPSLRCLLVRAQEMARYVESGTLDAGITGRDWVLEHDADVVVAHELV